MFVMERGGKKQKRVVLTIKTKTDICNRLEHGKNHNNLMKDRGIGSSTIYNIRKEKD
jgi:hypothetical protein